VRLRDNMKEDIKIEKMKKEFEVFSSVCPYCKKRFDSFYEFQLIHNMKIHIFNCSENPENKNEK